MIEGVVDDQGTPVVVLPVAGQAHRAIIDTGFNGDLELPDSLFPFVNPRFIARTFYSLAADITVEQDNYQVTFPFDGRTMRLVATFVPSDDILVGTELLGEYHLQIDFPARTVRLERRT